MCINPQVSNLSAAAAVPYVDGWMFSLRYVWKTTNWTDCEIPDGADVTCGSGAQTRDVTCVADDDVTQTPVLDDLCITGVCKR